MKLDKLIEQAVRSPEAFWLCIGMLTAMLLVALGMVSREIAWHIGRRR